MKSQPPPFAGQPVPLPSVARLKVSGTAGRLMVYSFAAVMDVILSSVLFVNMLRVAEIGKGRNAFAVAALMPVWALAYMLSSLVAGHFVRRQNAGRILIASCLLTTALSLAFIAAPGFRAMYVLMAVQGCVVAFFFTPFQYFMKLVDEGHQKTLGHSSGLYVFSWSSGYALGPFIVGFLWRYGWQICHLVNAAAALALAAGVYALKHQAEAAPSPLRVIEAEPDNAAGLPDLAWMAWVFSGLGCLIASLVRSVFPSSGEGFGIPKPDQGMIMFAMSATQAVVGLLLSNRGRWMYRAKPVLLFGLIGTAGLGLFGAAKSPALFYAGAVCFGLYSGFFYFYFVFHSLAHPTRAARYVSINEAVVGLGGIAGPTLGGLLAQQVQLSAPYLAAMGVLLIAIVTQARIHQRQRVPAGALPVTSPG